MYWWLTLNAALTKPKASLVVLQLFAASWLSVISECQASKHPHRMLSTLQVCKSSILAMQTIDNAVDNAVDSTVDMGLHT